MNKLRAIIRSDEGNNLIEYGLIAFLVSIGLLLALQALTGALNGVFAQVTAAL